MPRPGEEDGRAAVHLDALELRRVGVVAVAARRARAVAHVERVVEDRGRGLVEEGRRDLREVVADEREAELDADEVPVLV